mgnify:CR=1 FL=1
MKSRLLAVMALCGATSSTLPLWAAEWENPIPNFVEPNLATDGTGGGVYYVYHVATQKFITCGDYNHNWGTEVIVADEGKKLDLTYDTDYELSNRLRPIKSIPMPKDGVSPCGTGKAIQAVMSFIIARQTMPSVWTITSRDTCCGKYLRWVMGITVSKSVTKTRLTD